MLPEEHGLGQEQSSLSELPFSIWMKMFGIFVGAGYGAFWLHQIRTKGTTMIRQMPVLGSFIETKLTQAKQDEMDEVSLAHIDPDKNLLMAKNPEEMMACLLKLYGIEIKDQDAFDKHMADFQASMAGVDASIESTLLKKSHYQSGTDYRGETVRQLTQGLLSYAAFLNNKVNPNMLHGLYRSFWGLERVFISKLLTRFNASSGSGHVVSGGTEAIEYAIQMIVKAYAKKPLDMKSWFLKYGANVKPKILLTNAAHAAFYTKSKTYQDTVELVLIQSAPETQEMDIQDLIKKLKSELVIAVIASVNYMTGYPDNVPEIAKAIQACSHDIALHVDNCMGGYVYEYQQAADPERWPCIDFSVKGVTSMSICGHKHGLGPKGASFILFKEANDAAQRMDSLFDWTGGIYVTSGKGSQSPNALINAILTDILCEQSGHYARTAEKILSYSKAWAEAFNEAPDMKLYGFRALEPSGGIVTICSVRDNGESLLYWANEMAKDGLVFSGLQKPYRLHFGLTDKQVDAMSQDEFINDMMSKLSSSLSRMQAVSGEQSKQLPGAYAAVQKIEQSIPPFLMAMGLEQSALEVVKEVGLAAYYTERAPVKRETKKTS